MRVSMAKSGRNIHKFVSGQRSNHWIYIPTAQTLFRYMPDVLLIFGMVLGLRVLHISFIALYIYALYLLEHRYHYISRSTCHALLRLFVGTSLGYVAFTTALVAVYQVPKDTSMSANDVYSSVRKVESNRMPILVMNTVFSLSSAAYAVTMAACAVKRDALGQPSQSVSVDGHLWELAGVVLSFVGHNRGEINTDTIAIGLLVISFAITLTALRTRSCLSFINLLLLICLIAFTESVHLQHLLKAFVNPFPLVCFATRTAVPPLLDIFVSPTTVIDIWTPFLKRTRCFHYIMLVGYFLCKAQLYTFFAININQHKEWIIVLPIFIFFSSIYFLSIMLFFRNLSKLIGHIHTCNVSFSSLPTHLSSDGGLCSVMSSKGVRHTAMFVYTSAIHALITTILLAAVCWETKTSYSVAFFLVVFPVDLMVTTLTSELQLRLGGTCIGYSIVAPTISQHVIGHKRNLSATLISPDAPQESNNKATAIINSLQSFFSRHMITNFGCDYSTCGLSASIIETKLSSFFSQVINLQSATIQNSPSKRPRSGSSDTKISMEDNSGPKSLGKSYDTYLLYYSGPTYENGDWALSDGTRITFDTIQSLWQRQARGPRLILVLDSNSSHVWLSSVAAVKDYIAVQTAITNDGKQENIEVGEFTSDWTADIKNKNDEKQLWTKVCPVYSVSKRWSDFSFNQYDEHFEQIYYSAIPINLNFLRQIMVTLSKMRQNICINYNPFVWFKVHLRRCRYSWFKPRELNTGHGFFLVDRK